jgi:hypothetical protein
MEQNNKKKFGFTKLEKILIGVVFIGGLYMIFNNGIINVVVDSDTRTLAFSIS